MRRGHSFVRGPAFVDGSPSNTIPAGNDVFAEKMCHPRVAATDSAAGAGVRSVPYLSRKACQERWSAIKS